MSFFPGALQNEVDYFLQLLTEERPETCAVLGAFDLVKWDEVSEGLRSVKRKHKNTIMDQYYH